MSFANFQNGYMFDLGHWIYACYFIHYLLHLLSGLLVNHLRPVRVAVFENLVELALVASWNLIFAAQDLSELEVQVEGDFAVGSNLCSALDGGERDGQDGVRQIPNLRV